LQTKVLKAITPFLSVLLPCCNKHDICYGTCAGSGFTSAFKKCNSEFDKCMKSNCNEIKHRSTVTTTAKREVCKFSAATYYTAVSALGKTPYFNAQKEHCDCV